MKNLQGIFSNLISVLTGVLTFVFMAQPYFNYTVGSIIGQGTFDGTSGYSIIENGFESQDAKTVLLALSCLIIAILASVLILFGIFNLLTSTGVVKTKNAKVMYIANCIVSVIMVLIGVVALCCALAISKDNSGDFIVVSGKVEVAWALIVNFVVSFIALFASIVAKVSSDKKKKDNLT